MSRRTIVPARWAGVVLAAAGLAGVAAAQQEPSPLFQLETSGLRAMFPDEVDRAFVNAASMLPERVGDLSRELPAFLNEETALLARTALLATSYPMRMAVMHAPGVSHGPLGYAAEFEVRPRSPEEAATIHALLRSGLEEQWMAPVEIVDDRTMRLETPGGMLRSGFEPGPGPDEVRYSFRLGAEGTVLRPAPARPRRGYTRTAWARLDLETFEPAIQMGLHAAGPNNPAVQALMHELGQAGLVGAGSVSLEMELGHTANAGLSYVALHNARRMWEYFRLADTPLTDACYAVVPADAWTARLSRYTTGTFELVLDKLGEYGVPVEHALESFTQETDVDFRRDILESLGGTAALYASRSTGGSGVLSYVAMLQVEDPDRLADAHQKLLLTANRFRYSIPVDGRYVRLQPWEHDGLSLVTLQFPGVPVPLEITYAIEGNWLILAPTPQGAIAAAKQATGRGDGGLAANTEFARHFEKRDGLMGVTFIDTRETLRFGYPTVSLLGSGLANAVRSPAGGREPGLIVPPYAELLQHARPSIGYTYWEGDALVTETWSSRSLLVSLASKLGETGGGGGGMTGLLQGFAPVIMQGAERRGGMNPRRVPQF